VNWKPTAIAAVIVIAAGLAAGVLIGGKTRTIVREVAASAPEPTATPAATATPTASEPEPERIAITDEDLLAGDLVEDLEVVDSAQLYGGLELSGAVQFVLTTGFAEPPELWFIEIEVPPGSTRFEATAGFAPRTPSGNSIDVVLLADALEDERLAGPVHLTTTDTAEMSADVSQAAKVIVKLTTEEEMLRSQDDSDRVTFVLGDAHFE
jgi:hypothetical protein